MFTASDMRTVTEEAIYEKKIHDKCMAQRFFATHFNLIRGRATDGYSDVTFSINGEERDSLRAIVHLYRKLGYTAQIEQGLFAIYLHIEW